MFLLAKFNKLFCFWLQDSKSKVRSLSAELRSLGLAEDTDKLLALLSDLVDKGKKVTNLQLGKDGMSLVLEMTHRLTNMGELEKTKSILNSIGGKSIYPHFLTIARHFNDQGYAELAEYYFRECLKIGTEPEAFFWLGEIHQQRKDFHQAEQHYRRALELNPDEPRYYLKLIALYDRRYQEILEEALQKYPEVQLFQQLQREVFSYPCLPRSL